MEYYIIGAFWNLILLNVDGLVMEKSEKEGYS